MKERFEEQDYAVALVTGGTRGIGLETTRRLLASGMRVVALYRGNDEAAAAARQDLAPFAERFELVRCAIDDVAQVESMIAGAIERFGRLDILVNNAGIADDELLIHGNLTTWRRVVATNFRGTAQVTEAALPYLLRQPRSRIVNVVSLSALFGNVSQTAYSASKGAMIGLTRMLARLYGPRGLRCNAVAPGFVATDMLVPIAADAVQGFIAHSANRELLAPESVASVIAFLASPAAEAFNGSVLDCDGGFLK